MLTFSDEDIAHVKNIELEINAIQHTFASTTEREPNSFKPFAVFFSDPETKTFVITSRPVKDESDFYTAISEMLFAFTATKSQAVLFSLEATKQIAGQTYDLLEVYLACDHFCTVFSMPYYLDSNNKLQWLQDKFNIYNIDKLEKAYDTSGQLHATLEIFESLYLHSHMNQAPFELHKLKSFYDQNNFNYIVVENEKVNT